MINSVNSFLKSIEPAPQILTVGLPLVALNAVAGPGAAIAVGIGATLLKIRGTQGTPQDKIGLAGRVASTAVVGCAAFVNILQRIDRLSPLALPFLVMGGVVLGALGKAAVNFAAVSAEPRRPDRRSFTAATLSTSLLVGLSMAGNGSSWLGAALGTAIAAFGLFFQPPTNNFHRPAQG